MFETARKIDLNEFQVNEVTVGRRWGASMEADAFQGRRARQGGGTKTKTDASASDGARDRTVAASTLRRPPSRSPVAPPSPGRRKKREIIQLLGSPVEGAAETEPDRAPFRVPSCATRGKAITGSSSPAAGTGDRQLDKMAVMHTF